MFKKVLLLAAVALIGTAAQAEVIQDYEIDYSAYSKFPFYVMGYEPTFEDGVMKASNPGGWYQFFVADGISTEVGGTYTVTIMVKSSKEGSFNANLGWGWDEGQTISQPLNVTTSWTEQELVYNNVGGENCNIVLQPGGFDGDLEFKWLKVKHDNGLDPSQYWLQANIPSGTNPWDDQIRYTFEEPLEAGVYHISFDVTAEKDGRFLIWGDKADGNAWYGGGDYTVSKGLAHYTATWNLADGLKLFNICLGGLYEGKILFDNFVMTKDGESTNLIPEGNFSTGLGNFSKGANYQPLSIVLQANPLLDNADALRLFIQGITQKSNPWDNQVKHDFATPLEAGEYIFSFDVCGDADFTMYTWGQVGGNAWYGGGDVKISTAWTHVSNYWNVSDPIEQITFNFGSYPGKWIAFDNMTIKKVGEDENLLEGANFKNLEAGLFVRNNGAFGISLDVEKVNTFRVDADLTKVNNFTADGENWAADKISITDAEDYFANYEISVAQLNYNRTFASDNWQALYVPYNIAFEEWSGDAQVARLASINNEGGDLTLVWEEVKEGELVANTPYIIKPNTSGEVVFTGTNKKLDAANNGKTVECTSGTTTVTLAGTYVTKEDMADSQAYALANGTFYQTDKNEKTLKPFRIYLTISTPSAAPARISNIVDGNVTSIEDITFQTNDGVIYDVMGRKVENPRTGIFIQNGKKFIVR